MTAVAPDSDGAFRIEIDVDLPRARTKALRFTAVATIAADHPLFDEACSAAAWGHQVIWAIEWQPVAHVPDSVPIESLDLTREAHARLVSLVGLPQAADPVESHIRGELS